LHGPPFCAILAANNGDADATGEAVFNSKEETKLIYLPIVARNY